MNDETKIRPEYCSPKRLWLRFTQEDKTWIVIEKALGKIGAGEKEPELISTEEWKQIANRLNDIKWTCGEIKIWTGPLVQFFWESIYWRKTCEELSEKLVLAEHKLKVLQAARGPRDEREA
jgi:hypothetical protein